jgi:hypothetical protein
MTFLTRGRASNMHIRKGITGFLRMRKGKARRSWRRLAPFERLRPPELSRPQVCGPLCLAKRNH